MPLDVGFFGRARGREGVHPCSWAQLWWNLCTPSLYLLERPDESYCRRCQAFVEQFVSCHPCDVLEGGKPSTCWMNVQ